MISARTAAAEFRSKGGESVFLFVIGGSASGKSEYAESRAVKLAESDGSSLLYIAAMEPSGEDAAKRIRRHRKLREGKGFRTIECYRNIGSLCRDKDTAKELRKSTVILECLSSLTANEMFAEDNSYVPSADEKILPDIAGLNGLSAGLVVVSIDVSGDGCKYDEMTQDYIRCLGRLNRELARMADEAVEVVYGIPVAI